MKVKTIVMRVITLMGPLVILTYLLFFTSRFRFLLETKILILLTTFIFNAGIHYLMITIRKNKIKLFKFDPFNVI